EQFGRQWREERNRVGIPALHPDAPYRPPAKNMARLVIELLADFFADLPEQGGVGADRFGIKDFDDHRSIIGTAGLARAWFAARDQVGLRSRRNFGGRRGTGFIQVLEKELELVGVELLAPAPEHPADHQVQLLA